MLNEEKIRLMTRVAVYEKGLGAADARTARFFRNDYLFAQLIGSLLSGTLAWGICAAVYCGYKFEDIFFSVYENDLGRYLHLAAVTYAVFMGLYLLATFVIYWRRSAAFTRRRRLYGQDLDELMRISDREHAEAAALAETMEAE